MTPWVAPTPEGPVRGSVIVPGSKSATARALVLAALADGPSRLVGALEARDTRLMRDALGSLGVTFDDHTDGTVTVTPPAAFTPGTVDVGLAGTIMRFVPPLAALADGSTPFTGDKEAEVRPVAPLLDGLTQAGARVDGTSLPFTVHGTGSVRGGEATIDASGSSQFVSGLLLAAARFDTGLVLHHRGPSVPSRPHIGLTLAMLRDRGVDAEELDATSWRVAPGPIAARDETIEPDLINAAVFLAAALPTAGAVTVAWPRRTAQAADTILGVLDALGGVVTRTDGYVTVTGTGRVTAADLDLTDASELTCIAAALLALADGPGSIRGVAHIRGHETDRLAALETELRARGAGVHQTVDGLAIVPGPLAGGPWGTYADHRMAHAGAVLGLAVPGVALDDIGATTKTMADFDGLWTGLVSA